MRRIEPVGWMKRLILPMALAVTLAACVGDTAEPSTTAGSPPATSEPSPATTSGDGVTTSTSAEATSDQLEVVRYGLPGAVTHLDPSLPAETSEASVIALVSGQLLRWGLDGTPQPDLAESLDISDDGLIYTFTLREGLTYSDGTPLTVEDVVSTWERIKEAPGTATAPIANVVSVEAPDERTVVWTLSAPSPDLPFWFARHNFAIHPAAQVEADPDAYFLSPVSAGPYQIVEGAPGDPLLVLEENPAYPNGPMAVLRLELEWVPDLTTRALQLTTGDLDYVYELPPQAEYPTEVETFPVPVGGVFHLTINQQLPDDHCLSNRDVREAISLAMDRADINERALFGHSPVSTGYFYQGEPAALDILPNNAEQDLEAARALMASTPFADGCSMEVTTYGPRPGYVEGILVMAEQLAEIGIEVTPNGLEVGAALDYMLNSPDYEAGWAVTGSPGTAAGYLSIQWLAGEFWAARARLDNPEMNELLAELSVTIDPDARLELMHEIQTLGYEIQSIIPCCERTVLAGSRIGREHVTTPQGQSNFVVPPLGELSS